MASIRKRGKNYEIRVSMGYDSRHRKIEETTTFEPDPKWSEARAEKEARKFADRFEEKVKSGYSTAADKITFEKFSKIFLEDMKPFLAETTLHDYTRRLEMRIIPAMGQAKLSQINNHVVKEYIRMLRNEDTRMDGKPGGLKESSLKKERATISSILSYAVQEGYLTINPLIYAGKQRGRKNTGKEYKTNQLSIEQVKWFLYLLDHPVDIKRKAHTVQRNGKTVPIKEYSQRWRLDLKWRLFFYISILTGARRGEIIALTWDDLDFENNVIDFNKSTAAIPGKVIQKDTKTHSSRSNVVPPMVMTLARELLVSQKERSIQLGDYWKGHHGKQFGKNFVFIQDDGSQMHLGSPRREFKRLISIYNTNIAEDETKMLPEDITLHDLRHTTASILISQNMDARSVAGVLGHADPSTTLNIYAYFFNHKNVEAANIMQSVLLDSSVVGK